MSADDRPIRVGRIGSQRRPAQVELPPNASGYRCLAVTTDGTKYGCYLDEGHLGDHKAIVSPNITAIWSGDQVRYDRITK